MAAGIIWSWNMAGENDDRSTDVDDDGSTMGDSNWVMKSIESSNSGTGVVQLLRFECMLVAWGYVCDLVGGTARAF